MSAENPNLITHVPTQAELEASRGNEKAINPHDPAQLKAYNANLRALGYPERAAPGEYKPPVFPRAAVPRAEQGPSVEPANEQTRTGEQMRQLRAQVASEIGSTAVTGEPQQ